MSSAAHPLASGAKGKLRDGREFRDTRHRRRFEPLAKGDTVAPVILEYVVLADGRCRALVEDNGKGAPSEDGRANLTAAPGEQDARPAAADDVPPSQGEVRVAGPLSNGDPVAKGLSRVLHHTPIHGGRGVHDLHARPGCKQDPTVLEVQRGALERLFT